MSAFPYFSAARTSLYSSLTRAPSTCRPLTSSSLVLTPPVQVRIRVGVNSTKHPLLTTHTTRTVRTLSTMSTNNLYIAETPAEVKNAKGLHLITQNTPNGQATQIILEELADKYGTEWTTTLINISTNEQKKEWFLRLNPNGRIPTLVDNSQSPPFPVIETSAQIFYLLKFYDKDDTFGFKDELERNEALQWTFFWHGGGAPYQGQVNHFTKAAPEKIPCMFPARKTSR